MFRFFKRKSAKVISHVRSMSLSLYANWLNLSNKTIGNNNAMQVSTVFSCVKVLSESVGTLPMILYKSKDKTKQKAKEHPLYEITSLKPNNYSYAISFYEAIVSNLALKGNFYAIINRSNAGVIISLDPLNPDMVTKKIWENGKITYKITYKKDSDTTITQEFVQEDILDIVGFTTDGRHGMSVIEWQRQSMQYDNSAEEFGSKFIENNATPPSFIEIPQVLSDEAYKRMKDSFNSAYGGDNAGKTALLEGGATLKSISIKNTDAQYLESRRYQRSVIAGFFRVPLHMINDLERSTFSNIEQQSLEFVQFSLQPYLQYIEQAFDTQLLTKKERDSGFFFKFNVNALLRGDVKSRFEAYRMGRDMGVYSVNEIRSFEDRNPVENGDGRLQPLNFTELGGSNEQITEQTTE